MFFVEKRQAAVCMFLYEVSLLPAKDDCSSNLKTWKRRYVGIYENYANQLCR